MLFRDWLEMLQRRSSLTTSQLKSSGEDMDSCIIWYIFYLDDAAENNQPLISGQKIEAHEICEQIDSNHSYLRSYS